MHLLKLLGLFLILLGNESGGEDHSTFFPPPDQLQCKSAMSEERCTGSVYCTVCTDCSRCAHCKSALRSCGVCGKGNRRSTRAKRKSSYSPPTSNYTTSFPKGKAYRITQTTSLRELPDSKAKVILRLVSQTAVKVIDQSGEYWWIVVYEGRTGWVKRHLLEEI